MAKRMFASLLCPTEKVTEEQLITDANLVALDRAIAGLSRRSFMGRMAFSGAGLAAAGWMGASTRAEAQSAPPAISDVLNFALNLEFLEANLYASVSGQTPPAGGAVTGAPAALHLDAPTMATAVALYQNEMEHIALLKSAITSLGATPIAQPAIDLSSGGKVTITTQAQFLAVARQFTAVGNSAYAGAAQYLVSNTSVLGTAAQILGAEAQHLGAVNYLCYLQGVISPAVDALDYPPVTSPVKPATAPVPVSFFTVTPTGSAPGTGSALGPLRITSQVLGIVYGSSSSGTTLASTGVIKGGFFPNGVNGAIVST